MNELYFYNKINAEHCNPQVKITKTSIVLNVDCLKIMGSPKFIVFYISHIKSSIIIKPTDVLDAYKIFVPDCENELKITCPSFIEKIDKISRRIRKRKHKVYYNSDDQYILIK